MEKMKLTTIAEAPVPDNDNTITAGPVAHAAAGCLVISTSESTNDVLMM
jgi:hypothetical protein